jgi:hypothetical protein
MKENKLTIRINKPVLEVFEFTINPENTPEWLDSIVEETIEGDEITLGTRYINTNREGQTNSYIVSEFEIERLFELKSVPEGYTVRYTYTAISDTETELEYFEKMESGELTDPIGMSVLEKLKGVIENPLSR